jgi:hypothetical protein
MSRFCWSRRCFFCLRRIVLAISHTRCFDARIASAPSKETKCQATPMSSSMSVRREKTGTLAPTPCRCRPRQGAVAYPSRLLRQVSNHPRARRLYRDGADQLLSSQSHRARNATDFAIVGAMSNVLTNTDRICNVADATSLTYTDTTLPPQTADVFFGATLYCVSGVNRMRAEPSSRTPRTHSRSTSHGLIRQPLVDVFPVSSGQQRHHQTRWDRVLGAGTIGSVLHHLNFTLHRREIPLEGFRRSHSCWKYRWRRASK